MFVYSDFLIDVEMISTLLKHTHTHTNITSHLRTLSTDLNIPTVPRVNFTRQVMHYAVLVPNALLNNLKDLMQSSMYVKSNHNA